jgi:outer membrane receptor protein involved in Fe transport
MRTVFTSLILLLGWMAHGQSTTITGMVSDDDGVVTGCHIYIVGSSNGTYTEENGEYRIKTDVSPPFDIKFSFLGYDVQTVTINSPGKKQVDITLSISRNVLENIVVGASRYEERIMDAPVSIFKMSSTELKNKGGSDYYEAVSNMRGIQAQTSSLFLPSYNVRGFSDPGNFRFKQQLDGYDMTNPIGLAIANSMGVSDLDISSAELVHGASSALYGSDAFNGVLRFYSKNPFDFPGVSIQTKAGVTVQDAAGTNPYFEQDIRVAHLFSDKLAFKMDMNYKRAYDWIGDDFSHRIPAGQWDNHEFYEGLDYNGPNADTLFFNGKLLTRSGISEKDLFTTADFSSNKMENFRTNFSFFFRPADDWELEYTYKHSFSDWLIRSSSTFPQFDYLQRFHLFRLTKGGFSFKVYNHKLDNYKGTWSANAAASAIETTLRPNDLWLTDFQDKYRETGSLRDARIFADRFAPGGSEFIVEDFESALAATTQNTDYSGTNPVIIPGSQAVDFSHYTNADIDYDFGSALPVRLQVGVNYRRYNVESGGAFYNDGPLGYDGPIDVNQFAGYAQASKELYDSRLKLSVALRADKQTDYDLNVSPRATAVVKLGSKKDHIFRASYLTGYRNPSIQEGFFRLQLTSVYTIIGSAERSLDNFIYEGGSGTQFTMREILDEVAPTFDAVQPERNTSYEVGYRTVINDKLMIDANGFFTQYENFINRPNIFFRPGTADFQIFAIRQNRSETVNGMGAGLSLDYLINDNLSVGLTYDWNDYDSPDFEATDDAIEDDIEKERFLRSLQFNIPEQRASVSLSGRHLGNSERWGFQINTRYNGEFNYYSNLGEVEIPAFNNTDAAITYSIPEWKTTLKIGGSNVFRQEFITIYGAPQIGSVYYVGIRYEP